MKKIVPTALNQSLVRGTGLEPVRGSYWPITIFPQDSISCLPITSTPTFKKNRQDSIPAPLYYYSNGVCH